MKVSLTEFKAIKAKAEARKAKRTERAKELWPKCGKKKKYVPLRKRVFTALKAICKLYVLFRCKKRNGGLCEVGIVCGGKAIADTWYHGWPQKGGNGLRYDVRSHFASCGDCNMGEFGARYRGSITYENRHRELLGDTLFLKLQALHGRRQIKTHEAVSMYENLKAMIENGDFSL